MSYEWEDRPPAPPVHCICCGSASYGYLPLCGVPAHQYCFI